MPTFFRTHEKLGWMGLGAIWAERRERAQAAER
ncbi:hypothetical protein JOC69_000275 [Heliobacterium gestii]|nr:hypothetical protein [Heliomicrobium gestii]